MSALFANKKIRFLDTTLRDGEQTPGVSLTPEQKLKIAVELSAIGVDVIEAGSAVASEGEREAVRVISDAGLKSEICTYSRAVKGDIDIAADCGADSVHLVVPVSDLHITKKLCKTREQVYKMAMDSVAYAKERGLIVELSGEDASRADQKYLSDLFRNATETGADRLCFCDTVGLLTPEKLPGIIPHLCFAPLSIHCHNDFGLATANTVAALKAGASCAHTTINGLGERAGNTSFEEVVMTLERLYGYDTGIDAKKIYSLSTLVSQSTKIPLAVNKPVVGAMAFTHESGIHANGLLKDTSTYEPMPPETVGRKRRIVLGKHSGTSSVKAALGDLGYNPGEKQLAEIVARVKKVGDKGMRVTDADVMAIADSVMLLECKPVIQIDQFTVVSGSKAIPTASVTMVADGRKVTGAATGTGPVDAALNVLEQSVAMLGDIKLEEFHVDAINGGTDAVVDVTVKLRKDGRVITSRGADTDIIEASVAAVVAGMNRLLRQNDENRSGTTD
ncbi:D-citramalate synthase [Methanomicrobium sp. W14]|uniref:2-isopropylmalate synthase n=1 Tax=Methanomicrobium sp. W14 TaxID=2817839 RepID=UPI001AE6386F|nr:D-citramalate synthase [Methanomicrobium sp. W14]